MENFYVSIIFLGITLILFSLVWTLLDRKKAYVQSIQISRSKDELVEIINDADQMIVELNRYSDYIVSLIEAKQEKISEFLKNIEEKLVELEARTKLAVGQDFEPAKKAVKGRGKEVNLHGSESTTGNPGPGENKPSYKVIPLNSRYGEVIKLADQGYSDTEIAKKLGMGKGEIRLVIDTSRKI